MMKTLIQRVFGNSITSEVHTLSAFPNSRLEEVSRELQKKLELKRALEAKRAAEMTDDEKIALALAALRVKPRNSPTKNAG